MVTSFLSKELFFASSMMLLVAGCSMTLQSQTATPVGPSTPSHAAEINRGLAGMTTPPGDYRMGPGDLLEITLFNVLLPDQRVTPRQVDLRVSQQGLITIPLLGEISVKGLTVSDLEQELRKRYDKYIHNPQVGVFVKEHRQKVSVVGAVQRPGFYELFGSETVVNMLAFAGGLTNNAGNQVHVYRRNFEERENYVIDLSVLMRSKAVVSAKDDTLVVDMHLKAGDVINVPEAGMFFVDGAVRKSGSYLLGQRSFTRLTQALATAGGVDFELASTSDISIFRRGSPTEVGTTIRVDLNEILAGDVPDPEIETDDVIMVPVSMGKYFVKRFVGQLISGFSVPFLIPSPIAP